MERFAAEAANRSLGEKGMGIFRSVGLATCLIACAPAPQHSERNGRIQAASLLAGRFAASPLAKWNVRGAAAGADCGVLLIETSTVLDDSVVEAIHYGTGAYTVYDGGVRHFSRERAFRSVVYRDTTGRVWRYGDLSQADQEKLEPCR
jgi:hypothetical protein